MTNVTDSFTLLEILSSTGLQIKTDPGIPLIYIGFFFLIRMMKCNVDEMRRSLMKWAVF